MDKQWVLGQLVLDWLVVMTRLKTWRGGVAGHPSPMTMVLLAHVLTTPYRDPLFLSRMLTATAGSPRQDKKLMVGYREQSLHGAHSSLAFPFTRLRGNGLVVAADCRWAESKTS